MTCPPGVPVCAHCRQPLGQQLRPSPYCARPACRQFARYTRRREAGRCVECGTPVPAAARCHPCAAKRLEAAHERAKVLLEPAERIERVYQAALVQIRVQHRYTLDPWQRKASPWRPEAGGGGQGWSC